jgi:hypothetical protein
VQFEAHTVQQLRRLSVDGGGRTILDAYFVKSLADKGTCRFALTLQQDCTAAGHRGKVSAKMALSKGVPMGVAAVLVELLGTLKGGKVKQGVAADLGRLIDLIVESPA